jgi:hypothetical protein
MTNRLTHVGTVLAQVLTYILLTSPYLTLTLRGGTRVRKSKSWHASCLAILILLVVIIDPPNSTGAYH